MQRMRRLLLENNLRNILPVFTSEVGTKGLRVFWALKRPYLHPVLRLSSMNIVSLNTLLEFRPIQKQTHLENVQGS